MSLQSGQWRLLVASLVIAIMAIAHVRIISNVAEIILLFETSFLVGGLFQKYFNSADPILSTIIGCFTLLIGFGTLLGVVGSLNYTVIALCSFVLVASIILLAIDSPKISISRSQIFLIVLICCFGISIAAVVRYYSPYPIQIDTDVVKEAIRIDYIAKTGSAPVFLSGDLRPVAFDTMLSFVAVMTGVQGSDVVWYGVFATFPLYGLGIFLLARRFFRDSVRPAIAAIFGLLICGFWYLEGPAIILPETFSAIIVLYVIAIYLDWNPTGLKSLLILIGLLIFLDIGYYYAVVAIIPLVALLQVWPVRRLSTVSGIAIVSLASILTVGAVIFYGSTFGAQVSSVNLSFVEQFMLAAYTPLLLFFILLGFIITFIFSTNRSILPIAIYGLFVLAMLSLPIAFATRIEIFGRPELAMIASIGVAEIVSLAANYKSRMGIVCAVVIVAVCLPILTTPYLSWFASDIPVHLWHGLPLDSLSTEEGKAGLWLRANASSSGFIISDVESSAIMQSISGLPGMYDPVYFLNNLTVLNLTYSAMSSNFTSSALQYLGNISTNKEFYFVITSRTQSSIEDWKSIVSQDGLTLQAASDLVVDYPTNDPLYRNSLFSGFALVYSNPSVEIYLAP